MNKNDISHEKLVENYESHNRKTIQTSNGKALK
jgi:hypothetical protein